MKNVLLLLLVMVLAVPGGHAQESAPSKTERVVSGLLNFGAAVVKKQTARDEPKEAQVSSPASAGETPVATRIGESVGTLIQGVRDPGFLAEKLASAMKETGELVLREYLDKYKEEGRAYTRELAAIISERVLEHSKVASTLHSVRMLCWGVVIYLTVISLLIFYMLWRMKRMNERVLHAIEALQQLRNTEK